MILTCKFFYSQPFYFRGGKRRSVAKKGNAKRRTSSRSPVKKRSTYKGLVSSDEDSDEEFNVR